MESFEAAFTTRSAAETGALGAALGRALAPGDVVALVGDLGAGKTRLVRGACDGAEVPEREVASPTFAIVATYHGRIPVHHADLYRLADEDELHATGLDDLVGGDGALLVEWADRIPSALPAERLEIRLEHARAASSRRITLRGTGARHAALAKALAAAHASRGSARRSRGTRPPAPPTSRGGRPPRSR